MKDYAAVFHFDITGAQSPHWTVAIHDGVCEVNEGLQGEPTCTVKVNEKTFIAIEAGGRSAVAAFAKGKMKVSNVGHARRYDQAFYKFHEMPKD